MKVAGKSDPWSLDEVYQEGFEHVELYLNTKILNSNSINEIVQLCKNADVNIASVHTPHISLEDEKQIQYFEKTDEIASLLNAVLVLDSNPTSTRYLMNFMPVSSIDSETFGYENDPSVSEYYTKNYHLEKGYPLVYDTAHMHMSERDQIEMLEYLLQTQKTEMLPAIHMADGTLHNDGVAFGEGSINLSKSVDLLHTYDYQGVVVLETPREAQQEALEFFNDVTNR